MKIECYKIEYKLTKPKHQRIQCFKDRSHSPVLVWFYDIRGKVYMRRGKFKLIGKMQKIFFFVVAIAVVCLICYNVYNLSHKKMMQPVSPSIIDGIGSDNDPWKNVPSFALYLRFTSGQRWENEYKNVLLRTMKIFVPNEALKLLIVLDDEKPQDHSLGERLKNEWPYPNVCYRAPGDSAVYHNWGKGRMFWDMMYPETCTEASYVGYIDTDTFFSTLLTPDLLFEEGKPVIVAKIGFQPYACWAAVSHFLVGKEEVLQCMSTFPVMLKTSHLKSMREKLAQVHGKSFEYMFSDSAKRAGGMYCLCQFSIMCNYVWYYHRDEYAWHLQMVPNGNWSGANSVPHTVNLDYFHNKIKPEEKIPIPRVAVHLRYSITNGKDLMGQEPEPHIVDDFIREGLCYSGGFDRCPEKCKRWDRNKVHYNLYSFEWYQWFWDKRCFHEQQKHYKKVETILQYYADNRKEVFGLQSIDQMCSIFDNVPLKQ